MPANGRWDLIRRLKVNIRVQTCQRNVSLMRQLVMAIVLILVQCSEGDSFTYQWRS